MFEDLPPCDCWTLCARPSAHFFFFFFPPSFYRSILYHSAARTPHWTEQVIDVGGSPSLKSHIPSRPLVAHNIPRNSLNPCKRTEKNGQSSNGRQGSTKAKRGVGTGCNAHAKATTNPKFLNGRLQRHITRRTPQTNPHKKLQEGTSRGLCLSTTDHARLRWCRVCVEGNICVWVRVMMCVFPPRHTQRKIPEEIMCFEMLICSINVLATGFFIRLMKVSSIHGIHFVLFFVDRIRGLKIASDLVYRTHTTPAHGFLDPPLFSACRYPASSRSPLRAYSAKWVMSAKGRPERLRWCVRFWRYPLAPPSLCRKGSLLSSAFYTLFPCLLSLLLSRRCDAPHHLNKQRKEPTRTAICHWPVLSVLNAWR